MDTKEFTANSINDLNDICIQLMPYLEPPLIIALNGPMGSGKTTFVRALGNAFKSNDWVNSPTYAILQNYHTPTVHILHADLYRIENDIHIDHLDIPSLITPNTIACIEWANKTTLLRPHISIFFNVLHPTSRKLTMVWH
jgi:tRNA threonylcarbamoyladenosine biosynthesis protein TsaE